MSLNLRLVVTTLVALLVGLVGCAASGQGESGTSAVPPAASDVASNPSTPGAQPQGESATVAAAGAGATSSSATAPSGAAAAGAAANGQPKLLFFLNPDGRPCQMQNAILESMGAELSSMAQVKYVSTREPSARAYFNQYGVRALPTLILVDQGGSELHRFSPGIHEAAEISSALASKR